MAEPNLVLGFLGGMLIGLATVLLLALNGRIAGVSGILSGAVTAPDRFDRSWRLLFILGLMAGAALYRVRRTGFRPIVALRRPVGVNKPTDRFLPQAALA